MVESIAVYEDQADGLVRMVRPDSVVCFHRAGRIAPRPPGAPARREAEAAGSVVLRGAEVLGAEGWWHGDDAILDAVPWIFCLMDGQGRLLRWNRRLEEVARLGPGALGGSDTLGLFSADDRREIASAIEAARRGRCGQVEGHLATAEGTGPPYLWAIAPTADDRSEAIAIVGLGLGERKSAEVPRSRTEDLLRTITDSSKAVVYMKDLEGRYQLVNRQWASLFGEDRDFAIGKTDFEIFPPANAEMFRANDLRIIAGGRLVEIEEVAPQDDGPHTYLSIKVPLFGPEGEPYGICGISTDITDRKRMEEALRLGEEQFRGAFDAAAIGMALIDCEGRWVRVNRALCEILGYTEEALLATASEAIVHPEDREVDLELRRRAIGGEIPTFQVEERYVHSLGHSLWVRLSASIVRDISGQPLHFVVHIEDVTPRKRAEEHAGALRSAMEEAYEATICGWARALDLRDHETEGHSRRVAEVTVRLARAMGIAEADLVHVRRGASLHDIGKIGIPDAILLKPGPLDEEEWRVMRRHPELAAEMLAPIEFLRPALDIPHAHHEKWDGTGYPRGLSGEAIPLAARIFAVVDIWDALSHDRPYRAAWPADRVREHIRSLAGSHLDPDVVSCFLATDPDIDSDPAPVASGPAGTPEPALASACSCNDPVDDPTRLAVLHATGLLDSPAEASFDRLVQLAGKILHAPVALVSLVDDRRQFFKSARGLPEPWSSRRETPLSHSFCRQVVRSSAPLIIRDARLDQRVRDNPAIAELGVIAYAGMPLKTSSGHVLGSFCVIDGKPRAWDDAEMEILRDLCASVITEIELRCDIIARRRVEKALRRSRRRVSRQLQVSHELNRELERQRREMVQTNNQLAEMASTDGLTGLKNRRHFAEALPEAVARAGRDRTPLSILLIDIDEFKAYNDSFGHPAGDEVIRTVAETLAANLRSVDLAARYGGEEFVILLPETDIHEARRVAERLRRAVEARPFPHRAVTTSLGVTTFLGEDGRPWDIVNQADCALYQSKRDGRNRVTHHTSLGPAPALEPAPRPPESSCKRRRGRKSM